uniref:Wsv220-like protein n=1 Tax=Melicertus latisulcatus majanivirus TaxID=2984277 RepID=A0A9C7BMH2_9VIRU|nr:MAG: wsv220-like protein [Melicertus latisulcatus majanivirus]
MDNHKSISNKIKILNLELLNAKNNSISVFEEAVKNISIYLLEEAERGSWGDEQSVESKNGLNERPKASDREKDMENKNLGLYVPAEINLDAWRVGDPLQIFKDAYTARLIVNITFHHNKIAEIIYMLISELLLILRTNINEGKKQLQEYGRVEPMSINEIVKSLEGIIKEKKIEVDLQRFREIINQLETELINYDRESRLSDYFLDNIQKSYSTNLSYNSDTTKLIPNDGCLHIIDDDIPFSIETISSIFPSTRRKRPLKNIIGNPPDKNDKDDPWVKEREQTGYSIDSFHSIWMSEFADYPINLVNKIIEDILSKYIIPLKDVFHICLHIKAHLKCARSIKSTWYDNVTCVYELPPIYSMQDTWLELENILNIYAYVAKVFLNIYELFSSSNKLQDDWTHTKEIYINTMELLESIPVFLFDTKWMDEHIYSWPYTKRLIHQLPIKDYLSENYLLKTALIVPPNTLNPITEIESKDGIIIRLKIKAIERIIQLRTTIHDIFDDGFVTVVNDTHKTTRTSCTSDSTTKHDTDVNDLDINILIDGPLKNNPYIVHPLYNLKVIHQDNLSTPGLASLEEWDARYYLSSENGVLSSSVTNKNVNNNNNNNNNTNSHSPWFWRSLPLFKPSLLKNSSSSLPCKFWETALCQICNSQYDYNQRSYSKNTEILENMIMKIESTESLKEQNKIKDIETIVIQDKQLESYEKQEERRSRNVERSIFITILCKNLLTTLVNINV